MSFPRPIIYGCSGPVLLPEERDFFTRIQPAGFILFNRNCISVEQVKKLISDLKESVKREHVAILIDQEGGRIQRLTPPFWRQAPSASIFAKISEDNKEDALQAVEDNYWLIADDLHSLGINVNCAPVADIPTSSAHGIIGDRAFGDTPDQVASLCSAAIFGMNQRGIVGVMKHLPGHGRAKVDSHEELPIVRATQEELISSDFLGLRKIIEQTKNQFAANYWGMTAHIVYESFDKKNPATHSKMIVDHVIRSHIGFKGILLSDCLTMNALSGSFGNRAKKALEAGCDILLHCKGGIDDYIESASALRPMKEKVWKGIVSSLSFFKQDHLQDLKKEKAQRYERLEKILLKYGMSQTEKQS